MFREHFSDLIKQILTFCDKKYSSGVDGHKDHWRSQPKMNHD